MKEILNTIENLKLELNNDNLSIDVLNKEIKPKFFGKNSLFLKISEELKNTSSIEEKKALGKKITFLKEEMESIFNKEIEKIKDRKEKDNLNFLEFDRFSSDKKFGTLHVLTKTMQELETIFKKYGFSVTTGQEIEKDYYNFTALNIPKYHPARQMQDTFYVESKNNEELLLRTHATAVSARAIENCTLPLKNVSLARVFRNDSDKTHSPVFHQFELVFIDKDVNFSHLKFYIERLLKEFFENEDIKIHFRPSFFPFTSPSMEVDINYREENGKMILGEGDKKLELLGAGLLHKNVLNNMNIDSEAYSGIAFGVGIERLTMLKHGCSDIREFFANNLNWSNSYDLKTWDL